MKHNHKISLISVSALSKNFMNDYQKISQITLLDKECRLRVPIRGCKPPMSGIEPMKNVAKPPGACR